MKLEVWTDGTSRPKLISKSNKSKDGHSAIAYILKCGKKVVCEESKYVGLLDNNQAEYVAFIYAVEAALEFGARYAKFYTDSKVLETQMNYKNNVHSEAIVPYYMKARTLLQLIPEWEVVWISRKNNREADKLAFDCIKNWSIDQTSKDI